MIDYNGLEALVTVTKEKSFTKAAECLFLTQAAVTHRIKNLEAAVGQPLLIRTPTIKPTSTGQHLSIQMKKYRFGVRSDSWSQST